MIKGDVLSLCQGFIMPSSSILSVSAFIKSRYLGGAVRLCLDELVRDKLDIMSDPCGLTRSI